MSPSVASFSKMIEGGQLDKWIGGLRAAAVSDQDRQALRQILRRDAEFLSAARESRATLLMARTLNLPSMGSLRMAWRQELLDLGQPWIELRRALCRADAVFPTSFSPSGTRFISADQLFDTDRCEPLAEFPVSRFHSLEGRATEPRFHFGDRFIVDGRFLRLHIYCAETGQVVAGRGVGAGAQWHMQCFDRRGDLRAFCKKAGRDIVVESLTKEFCVEKTADQGALALAISPCQGTLAVLSLETLDLHDLNSQGLERIKLPKPAVSQTLIERHDSALEMIFVDSEALAFRPRSSGWWRFDLRTQVFGRLDSHPRPRFRLPEGWAELSTRRGFRHVKSGRDLILPEFMFGACCNHPRQPYLLVNPVAVFELHPKH